MEDYERFVQQIEPSMTLVHESAHTRTYLSEHPIPCVQRILRIDRSIVERHTEREIGAQIQAYRENGAAGFRVRWFYPTEKN